MAMSKERNGKRTLVCGCTVIGRGKKVRPAVSGSGHMLLCATALELYNSLQEAAQNAVCSTSEAHHLAVDECGDLLVAHLNERDVQPEDDEAEKILG